MRKVIYRLCRIISTVKAAPLYHYCLVRSDLPVGAKCAQIIHAAGESSPGGASLPNDTRAVALIVPDEAELLRLHGLLLDAGIEHCLIREPDAPYYNQAVALGVCPLVRTDKVRALLGHYELVK